MFWYIKYLMISRVYIIQLACRNNSYLDQSYTGWLAFLPWHQIAGALPRGVSRGQKSSTTIVSYASFFSSYQGIEFYSMASDTWTLFHQAISKAMLM